MTYSELLAAIDLYALEKPALAVGYKAAAMTIHRLQFFRMSVSNSLGLLEYITDEAKEPPPNSESESMTLVNWTPDPP